MRVEVTVEDVGMLVVVVVTEVEVVENEVRAEVDVVVVGILVVDV